MSDAIDLIHRDHVNMNKVLAVMGDIVDGLETAAEPERDLDLLTSVVYYIRLYPDRCHHPKEEKYLFKALGPRKAEARDLIKQLERQHIEGSKRIDAVDAALKDYDRTRGDLAPLRQAVHDYIAFQRDHMDLEESRLLPLAREALPNDDWGAITLAFAGDADPMFSENLETGFRVLFDRITRHHGGAGHAVH